MTHRPDIGRLLALLEPVKVLDAYSCIGGGTKGLRRAFGPRCHITGVDIQAQPDYCGDAFHQGDAIEYIRAHGHEYDFIHASPPCQGEGAPSKGTNKVRNAAIGRTYPRLIAPTRMFGLGVLMRRYFELGGWSTAQPAHPKHRGYVRGYRHGVYRHGPYVAAYGKGGGKATVPEIQWAKRIDWSTDHLRLREALPPAYTEWIGRAYLAALASTWEVAA